LRVVVLISVDAFRTAVLSNGANRECVAICTQSGGKSEPITVRELIAHTRFTSI
jgi:hypothetical protein